MPLIRARDLDVSVPEYLVQGMLPRRGICFLYGPSTVGKSLVTNGELALAVGNGTSFFGHPSIQGDVIICLGEGQSDAGLRMSARLAREQLDRKTASENPAIRGNLTPEQYLASLPPYTSEHIQVFDTEGVPFDIHTTNTEGEMTRSLVSAVHQMRQADDLELVIIDTLADFAGMSISNDSSASRVVKGLRYMADQLKCCVLVVAHPTKNGKEMLGAGRFKNAADCVIQIEPETAMESSGLNGGTLITEKMKQGPLPGQVSYVIEPIIVNVPVQNENREPIPGLTEPVPTATVRLRNEAAGADNLPQQNTAGTRSLLTAEPVPPERKPRKQFGPAQTASAGNGGAEQCRHPEREGTPAACRNCPSRNRPAPALPELTAELDQIELTALTAGLLSVPCLECGAPATRACNPLPGSQYGITAGNPVHTSRVDQAIARDAAILDQLEVAGLLAQFVTGEREEAGAS